jgi:hypothetical protein
MAIMRVLVGNEPRTYREVLATALQELRPTTVVALIDPEELEAEIANQRPSLVICSRLTAEIRRAARVWLLLYPNGEGRSVFGTGDHEQHIASADLNTLLMLVDHAAALTGTSGGPQATGTAPAGCNTASSCS